MATRSIQVAPRSEEESGGHETKQAVQEGSDNDTAKWDTVRTKMVPAMKSTSAFASMRAKWLRSGTRVVPYIPPNQLDEEGPQVIGGDRRVDEVPLLIAAAHKGNTGRVRALLKSGVKVDAVLQKCEQDDPCLQTALTKAVRYGHVETARVLLDAGADPLSEDYRKRTPYYYAAYSVTAGEGKHPEMMTMLLEYMTEITPKLLRLACHSKHNVADIVLDTIERKVVTRDSQHRYTVAYRNLSFLDDTTEPIIWPDFSESPAHETCLHALVAREAHEVTHPVVMGYLNWKVDRFGLRMAIFELLTYFVWLLFISVSAILISLGAEERGGVPYDVNSYNFGKSADVVRFVCESMSLVLAAYIGYYEIRDMQAQKLVGSKSSILDHGMRLAVYMIGAVLAVLRVLNADVEIQINLTAIGVVVGWLNYVRLLVLVPHLGQFFIMVSVMLRQDIPLFLSVLFVIVPGFAIAFTLLYNNSRELMISDEGGQFRGSALSSSFTSLMTISGLDIWQGPRDVSVTFSALWLTFALIGPVLALNLLIAMLNNTYSRLRSAVTREWVMRIADYVVRRETLLDDRISKINKDIDGEFIAIKAHYHDLFVDDYTSAASHGLGGTQGEDDATLSLMSGSRIGSRMFSIRQSGAAMSASMYQAEGFAGRQIGGRRRRRASLGMKARRPSGGSTARKSNAGESNTGAADSFHDINTLGDTGRSGVGAVG